MQLPTNFTYISHRFHPFTVTLLQFLYFGRVCINRNNVAHLKCAHFYQGRRMKCPTIRTVFILNSEKIKKNALKMNFYLKILIDVISMTVNHYAWNSDIKMSLVNGSEMLRFVYLSEHFRLFILRI